MNGGYLIPANSKKSMLILSLFNYIDLFVFGTGVVITVLLLLLVSSNNLGTMIAILTPGLIGSFLVLPVPNYHNIMTLIWVLISYFSNRRNYIWKGWCVRSGNDK